jgi:hypothetical protein
LDSKRTEKRKSVLCCGSNKFDQKTIPGASRYFIVLIVAAATFAASAPRTCNVNSRRPTELVPGIALSEKEHRNKKAATALGIKTLRMALSSRS